MNTKPIPAVITLIAAAISCVASIVGQVGLRVFTIRLLVTVVLFLIIGAVARIVIDMGFKTMADKEETDTEETTKQAVDLEDVQEKGNREET